MKKLFAFFLTLVLLAAALPLTAVGGEEPEEIFFVTFPDVTLTCGENDNVVTCTVTCRIAEGERMLNGKFTVTYDPQALELQIPGGKKKDLTDLPGDFVNTNQAGTVIIAFSDNYGLEESCCIGRLPFKVLHPRTGGEYTVTFRCDELVFYNGTVRGRNLIAEGRDYCEEGRIRVEGEAPMDYSQLQAAMEWPLPDLSLYTEESAAAYTAALAAAKAVLADTAASQETVDGAYAAFAAAFKSLTLKPADKAALQREMEGAITDLSSFSRKTSAAYTAALDAARKVLADPAATQEAVDGALAALIDARESLTERIILKGDPDGDETVTSTDARLTLQLAVNKIKAEDIPCSDVLDVDGDGTVTSTDARLILQKAVGKIEDWPTA